MKQILLPSQFCRQSELKQSINEQHGSRDASQQMAKPRINIPPPYPPAQQFPLSIHFLNHDVVPYMFSNQINPKISRRKIRSSHPSKEISFSVLDNTNKTYLAVMCSLIYMICTKMPRLQYLPSFLKKCQPWGTWTVQSIKHPPLGFGSSCELRVLKSRPYLGSTLSEEYA